MRADRIWLGHVSASAEKGQAACSCTRSHRSSHSYKPSLHCRAATLARASPVRPCAAAASRLQHARLWRARARRRADDSDSEDEETPKLKNISRQLNSQPAASVSVDDDADEALDEEGGDDEEDEALEEEGDADEEDDVESAQDAIR